MSFSNLTIKCCSRELLLHFSRLNRYFAADIISTRSAKYLTAREILIFINEGRAIWSVFEQSNMLDKFTQINDFVELYLSCYWNPDLPPSLKEKIKQGFTKHNAALIQLSFVSPYALNLIYWKVFTDSYLDTLTLDDLKQAEAACMKDVHVRLLQKISILLNRKNVEKQVQIPLEASHKSRQGRPEINSVMPSRQDAVPLSKSSQSPQSKTQNNISSKPIENSSSNNLPSTIAWCITKGFFIGVLITGIAILLMMFINYQMDVPLFETINNLWIAGIVGAFAEVVATACFLSEAKVFEPSTFASVSEKPDNSKSFSIPAAQPTTPTAAPAYQKPFSPASKTADTPNSPVQQAFAQTLVDTQNGMS